MLGVDPALFSSLDPPGSCWRPAAKTLILGSLAIVRQTTLEQLAFVRDSAKWIMWITHKTLLLSHFTYEDPEAQRS